MSGSRGSTATARIEAKLDHVATEIAKIGILEERIENHQESQERSAKDVAEKLSKLEGGLSSIEAKIAGLPDAARVAKIEERLAALEVLRARGEGAAALAKVLWAVVGGGIATAIAFLFKLANQ